MYPHERSLVKRLKDAPFALIGINSDAPDEKTDGDQGPSRYQNLKKVLEKEQITWPSWADGGTDGPIAKKWNIHGWPTIFVLDAKGVIRFKNKRGEALDAAVDQLLGEMKSDSRKSK
jgi:hypothetical protein